MADQHSELRAKLLKMEARRRAAHLADQMSDFDRSVDEAAAEPDPRVRLQRFAALEQLIADGLG